MPRFKSGWRLHADVAHLVERHLAKVEVASSSLVIRSSQAAGSATEPAIFFAKARQNSKERRLFQVRRLPS